MMSTRWSRRPTRARRRLVGMVIVLTAALGYPVLGVAASALSGVEIGTALYLQRDPRIAPLAGATFYKQADSSASRAAVAEADPRNRQLLEVIAAQPQGIWVGDWIPQAQVASRVRAIGAAAGTTVPIFVIYAIPGRDCGQNSAGGSASEADYSQWISQVAAGLGQRISVVVLEPDALAQMDCLSTDGQAARSRMLDGAVRQLSARAGTLVYLDAGGLDWHPAAVMAQRLRSAGVSEARGFALNVSNFHRTPEVMGYAENLSALVGGARAVLDTSRNGNGASPAGPQSWCNPPGRALGAPPTAATASTVIDALLWVKPPGESDGVCGPGQLPAGQFDIQRALELARNAGY